MSNRDFYQILGVEKKSSTEDIKKAYRKLAHKYHPDKESGNESKFKEITEAYSVLSDEKKRAEYDAYGKTFAGNNSGGQNYGGFDFSQFQGGTGSGWQFDLNDIFSEFFGGGARIRRGRDISIDIELTFKESIFGTTKKVMVNKPLHHSDGKTTREPEEIVLNIPSGVNNGEMMRLSGRGEAIPDGSPGDLYVKIHVQTSNKFRKEGFNIISKLDLKITDALLGANYSVETLEGVIDVKIPKGISHGELLRIKGKGVPVDNIRRGDLLLRIEINIPPRLSRRAKKLVEQLQQEGL